MIKVCSCSECPYFSNPIDDAKLCGLMVNKDNTIKKYEWIIDDDASIPYWCPFEKEDEGK